MQDSSTATATETVIPTMATSLPAAGGGVKGKRSVCCGRRARKVLRHRRERRAPQTVHNRQPVCRLPPYNPNGRHKNIPARLSRDIEICKEILLAGLFNSNSHGNGHTDHGVVTSAQEAHHFHVQAAKRRLLCCSATVFAYLIPMREACHRGMVTRTFYKENVTLSRPKEE